MISSRSPVFLCILLAGSALAQAQAPARGGGNPTAIPAPTINSVRPDYELGVNDQILISLPEMDEINQRPFLIDSDGFINLPLIGKVRAAGLLVRGLEAELTMRARDFARDPHVTVYVIQFRSEPVTFVGSFHNTGILP